MCVSFAIDSVKTEGKESCGRVSFFGRDTKRIWGSHQKRRKKKLGPTLKKWKGRCASCTQVRKEIKSCCSGGQDTHKKKSTKATRSYTKAGGARRRLSREKVAKQRLTWGAGHKRKGETWRGWVRIRWVQVATKRFLFPPTFPCSTCKTLRRISSKFISFSFRLVQQGHFKLSADVSFEYSSFGSFQYSGCRWSSGRA